jgi:hypothetical protein
MSSRSHLIFCLRIEKTPKGDPFAKKVIGKLTFIDLAGSERLARIGVNPKTYVEGLSINEGL